MSVVETSNSFERLAPEQSTLQAIGLLPRSGPRRITLALGEYGLPKHALVRAAELAAALGARLHVVRVLPRIERLRALASSHDIAKTIECVQRGLRCNRTTRAWLESLPRNAELVEHVAIVHGDFVQEAAAYSARVGADLIIVASRGDSSGEEVAGLANEAETAVLIARAPAVERTIVAATDLESPGNPVLSKAAELGQKLGALLIAVHDGCKDLSAASDRLPVAAQNVVASNGNAVETILGQARAHRADLIVVGVRRRNPSDRSASRSIAARIVNGGKRYSHSIASHALDAASSAPLDVI
jgi:nucleotide-binding universal stress UspA family protein